MKCSRVAPLRWLPVQLMYQYWTAKHHYLIAKSQYWTAKSLPLIVLDAIRPLTDGFRYFVGQFDCGEKFDD